MLSFSSRTFCKWMFCAGLFTPITLYGDPKTFLVTLPAFTLGHEGAIRAEYNLFEKGTLALEWTGWFGKAQREELTKKEIKDYPGASLRTEGSELGVMFGRYTDPIHMSGFNWGMGLGFRSVHAQWDKLASASSDTKDVQVAHFNAEAFGPTISARLGYRFVEEQFGFTIGSFLGVKQFISRTSDHWNQDRSRFMPLSSNDKTSLERRLATSLKLGVEIGWAF